LNVTLSGMALSQAYFRNTVRTLTTGPSGFGNVW
jgi:hypothetical protein